MGISYRQARRLWYCYQREGPKGLVPKNKGKPSNNQLSQGVKEKAIALVRTNYANYGPTLVAEKLDDYFATLKGYLLSHGRPKAFYSDKHSIFRVNMKGCEGKKTTFHRAIKELDIELICAHSPQAKGRVERTNGVLQDRLIKELREKKIGTMEERNASLEKFRQRYNKQFGKEAADPKDGHRKLLESHNLDKILLEKNKRMIAKDLSKDWLYPF